MNRRVGALRAALERLLEMAKCPSSVESEDVVSYVRRVLREDEDSPAREPFDRSASCALSYAAECTEARAKALSAGNRELAAICAAKREAAHAIHARIVMERAATVCAHDWSRSGLFEKKECRRCGIKVD